jgi:hypothetical protein
MRHGTLFWLRLSKFQNLGLRGTDYTLTDISDQLLLGSVTVQFQDPWIASEVLEHAVLIAPL